MRIYLYGSSSACDPWPPFHGTDMALFLSVKLISAPRGRGCSGTTDLLQTERVLSLSRSVTHLIRASLVGSKVVQFGPLHWLS